MTIPLFSYSKRLLFLSLTNTFLLGSVVACTEKPKITEPITTAAQDGNGHSPSAPSENPDLTAKDFDPAGIVALVEGEGKDYTRVANPQSVQVLGKAEVIEFFWYGCSPCYKTEPAVQAWRKTITKDVNFIRLPAQWSPSMAQHQKIALSLQALNKSDELDAQVFNAIQEQSRSLTDETKITEFMAENGIDKTTWEQTFNSFNVNSEVSKANALFKAYQLQGIPAFVVNGKYLVRGNGARSLQVVNKLIEQDNVKK